MGLVISIDPIDGEAVVPMATLCAYLRVDAADEDVMIASLRLAAISWVERYVSVSLARRRWRWTVDRFVPVMWLPRGPLDDTNVVSVIRYRGRDGATTALGAGAWLVSGGAVIAAPGTCWPEADCSTGAVTIEFEAGYARAAAEAPELITAVMMLVRHWFDGDGEDVPKPVSALCDVIRDPVMG